VLRFPVRDDAVAKAAHLRSDTSLTWKVTYHPDTARFGVVLDDRSRRLVTDSTGCDDRGTGASASRG
jgi:hypothetical protein